MTDAVFDKTGTLTQGKLSVRQFANLSAQNGKSSLHDNDCIAVAHLLEQHSEHPMAKAVLAYRPPQDGMQPAIQIAQKTGKTGHGVSAQITLHGHTQTWAIGKPEFVAQIAGKQPALLQELARQGSLVALGNEQGFQAAFVLQDETKPDAAAILQQLVRHGITLHILSGDNQAAVSQLADELGITHYRAAATPEDKLAYVQQLQADGKRVLMLGDGINDAPVLAAADVSVAVAGSADVARDGADVVLLNEDFSALPVMLAQAARTRRIIRQNLIWATVYNLLVVPLAVLGYVTPWIAAIGMSASSLMVVWNALRLRKYSGLKLQ